MNINIINQAVLKHFFSNIIWCLIALLALNSCNGHDEPYENGPAEHTILVYMIATNNLALNSWNDITEMQRFARETGLGNNRLILYHHVLDMNDRPNCNAMLPVLKEVTSQGVDTLKIYASQGVDALEPVKQSATAARMRQVIADVKALAPANNYGIVLWSHASGWLNNGLKEPELISPASFGSDQSSNKDFSPARMNIPTLASVLDGQDFSYVYMDCCYMASVEVAYELKDVTDYIIASATELPADGMPYDRTLPFLLRDDYVGAARATFEYYDNQPDPSDRSCTMSVVRCDALDRLAEATRELYQQSSGVSPDYRPQKFMYYASWQPECYHYDLAHYAEAMASDKDVAENWHLALNDVVIYADNTPCMWDQSPQYPYRIVLENHCGLSTFILQKPSDASVHGYNELRWYTDVARYSVK